MYGSKRVIVNTGILYIKTLVSIFVSLYATRFVLNALGATDYGLYNLVAGVVAMLSFLKVSMSTSTQRFLSFSRGKGNLDELKSVFSSSVLLHFVIGIGIVILLEIIGLPFLTNSLNIPSERLSVAKVVFHLMVLNTFFTINSVPYEGLLNANENVTVMAILGVFESVMKLLISISLFYIDADRLIVYSSAMVILTFLIRILTLLYCRAKYDECKGGIMMASTLKAKEMFSFAAWNSFGSLCSLGRNQGVAVIINLFFGVITNAAYGIANQVSAQLSFFSQSMLVTLRPQIMQSEGAGNRTRMLELSNVASKFSFFLLAYFAIPVMLELPFILRLWLSNVPDNTVVFCRLIILLSLVVQISVGLSIAIQAAGKIKNYQAIVGSFLLLTLPLGYAIFSLGYPSYAIMLAAILIEVLATILRIFFAKRLVNMSYKSYLVNVVIRGCIPVILTVVLTFLLTKNIANDVIRLGVVGIISTISLTLLILIIGTDNEERKMINQMKTGILVKIKSTIKR